MKKPLSTIARLIVVVAGMSAAILAAAAAPDQMRAGDKNGVCLACHKQSVLDGSVHSKLTCSDCHALPPGGETKDIPHAPKKAIALVDCTAKCHREDTHKLPGLSPSFYADSVHGQGYLERGEKDVAKCWDCHGKHNIKPVQDPDSVVSRRRRTKTP